MKEMKPYDNDNMIMLLCNERRNIIYYSHEEEANVMREKKSDSIEEMKAIR